MAEGLGGKSVALGGHKTTDRRFHGRGNNIGGKVETKAFGGGHMRLKQAFITGGLSARTAMPRSAAPPKLKIGG